jgi:tetraacyldisaccharide 4'-kinase
LRRADGVVLTRCDQADDVAATVAWLRTRLRPGVPIAATEHRAIDPQLIAGKPTAMLCGIGQPAAFRRTLESLGATIVAGKLFADHHAYTRDDVEMLRRWAESLPAETVIAVTQKDQVKLRLDDLAGRLVVPVRIGLWFRDGEAELLERIRAAVSPNG